MKNRLRVREEKGGVAFLAEGLLQGRSRDKRFIPLGSRTKYKARAGER